MIYHHMDMPNHLRQRPCDPVINWDDPLWSDANPNDYPELKEKGTWIWWNGKKTYIKNLSPDLKGSFCTCSVPDNDWYGNLVPDGTNTIDFKNCVFPPAGIYCKKCLKPSKHSLFSAFVKCKECFNDYIPKPVPGTYPVKHRICDKCGGTVLSRNERIRRQRLRQN